MLFLLSLFFASAFATSYPPGTFCDRRNNKDYHATNNASGLNYKDCNNAGYCFGTNGDFGICLCCTRGFLCGTTTWACPTCWDFSGSHCTTIKNYYVAIFGLRFAAVPTWTETDPWTHPEMDVQCDTALGTTQAQLQTPAGKTMVPSLQNSMNAIFRSRGYTGVVLAGPCVHCSKDNPCNYMAPDIKIGMIAIYISEFNTYYSPALAPAGCLIPNLPTEPRACTANTDFGLEAKTKFEEARGTTDLSGKPLEGGVIMDMLNLWFNNQGGCCDPSVCTQPPASFAACLDFKKTQAFGYGESISFVLRENVLLTYEPTPDPTSDPTTPEPTEKPTPPPSGVDDPVCGPYINKVGDIKFIGVGDDCLKGINPAWQKAPVPGGVNPLCGSPYVICLPLEHAGPNTHSTGWNDANPTDTKYPLIGLVRADNHRYSIEECKEECAWDQRCLGMQFVADDSGDKMRGDCMLVDDIPVEITNPVTTWNFMSMENEDWRGAGGPDETLKPGGHCCTASASGEEVIGVVGDASSAGACARSCLQQAECNAYSYGVGACSLCKSCHGFSTDGFAANFNSGVFSNYDQFDGATALDAKVIGGPAMCFAKKYYCNPYFEASDIDEAMLNCYCPNNRKGFYTKKVKRTVANTKHCGGDSGTTERIKKAQANRMFHLCENWCLFETEDPMGESWYWDPWVKCWREQYAGIGMHRSYCNRVIRDPYTIEQQFINKRATMFCDKKAGLPGIPVTPRPTDSPVEQPVEWFLADEEENCDERCATESKVCDAGKTAAVITKSLLQAVVAGMANPPTCNEYVDGVRGWALPGLRVSSGKCTARHANTENTGCDWAIGVNYKRFCACA